MEANKEKVQSAEEIFNTIPFLDVDKTGNYLNIDKRIVIERLKEFAQQHLEAFAEKIKEEFDYESYIDEYLTDYIKDNNL